MVVDIIDRVIVTSKKKILSSLQFSWHTSRYTQPDYLKTRYLQVCVCVCKNN